MIDSKDISVVVQGAIDPHLTPVCLVSIRTHLPQATIILSTWKGTAPNYLDYDVLVESDDPGAHALNTYGTRNNVNRQILSTKNGLRRVNTPYALKIRSDMELTGSSFLRYFREFPARCNDFKFLRERLLISNFYTSNPHKTKFLFHPSDWMCFGLREDVLQLWDIELAPEPEMSAYFRTHKKEFPLPDPVPTWKFRYIPEQYICISFVNKFYQLDFKHYLDFTPANFAIWNGVLANNFVVLDYHGQLDMKFLKYDPDTHRPSNQLTYLHWLRLYQEWCDQSFRIPLRQRLKRDFKRSKLIVRIRERISRFAAPFLPGVRWGRAVVTFLYCVLRLSVREIVIRLRYFGARR